MTNLSLVQRNFPPFLKVFFLLYFFQRVYLPKTTIRKIVQHCYILLYRLYFAQEHPTKTVRAKIQPLSHLPSPVGWSKKRHLLFRPCVVKRRKWTLWIKVITLCLNFFPYLFPFVLNSLSFSVCVYIYVIQKNRCICT